MRFYFTRSASGGFFDPFNQFAFEVLLFVKQLGDAFPTLRPSLLRSPESHPIACC